MNGIAIHTARSTSHTDVVPVVLLHGFPESMLSWRIVAPELAKSTSVVCLDLRGYGESDPPKGEDPKLYSKQTMAQDVHEVMQHFGYDRYIVVGHDRGGCVAFRLALDYPDEVAGVVILDVLPTLDTWQSLQGTFGVFGYHMFLLAQPTDYPERLIGAAPEIFFNNTMDNWNKTPHTIPQDIREKYLDYFKDPETLHAMCQDYRAGAFVDPVDDQAAKDAGKKIQAPLTVLWQKPEGFELPFDPIKVWQEWSDQKVSGYPVACGHFIQEEKPDEVVKVARELLASTVR